MSVVVFSNGKKAYTQNIQTHRDTMKTEKQETVQIKKTAAGWV